MVDMSLPNAAPAPREGAPADQLVLEVVAGHHAGVSLLLDAGACCIGSSHEADVLLRDRGVAPTHVRMWLDRSLLCIEAEGGVVSIGTELLPVGHGCQVRLPAQLALGEALLCVSRNQSTSDTGASFTDFVRELVEAIGPRRSAAAVMLVGSLLALSVMAYPHTGREVASPAPMPPAAAPMATATLDQVMDELVSRIEAAKLRGLRVRILDGGLVVSGQLARREHDTWKAIERWFDQSYGARLALAKNVTVNEGRPLPLPQLQALYFGARPYIITASGARHEPGSMLDNGWMLAEIGEGRVILSRD